MLNPILALGWLLQLSAPASAQQITAGVLLPEAGWPVGEDIVAINEQEVVVLLPPTENRPDYLIERRGADLQPSWSESVDLSRTPGGGGLYDPAADRQTWTNLQANDEVVWIFYMEGLELKARAVDPATGAASDTRDVARIGDERATRERFASTRLSGSHPHPGAIPFAASPNGRYYVVGATEVGGGQSLLVFDEDLGLINDFDLEESGLFQVRFQVTDEGTLMMAGAEKGGTELFLFRVPLEGESASAIIDLGDRRTIRDLRMVESDSGAIYSVALSGTPGNRIDALHVLSVEDSQVRFANMLDNDFLKENLDSGLLGLGFQGLDGFVRLVHADFDPDGNLLVGMRPMFATEGKNTTTELNRFSARRDKATWEGLDTTLLSFDPAGGLRWASVVPTSVKTGVPFELSTPVTFTDASLRMVYRSQSQGRPALKLLDVSLSDGALGDPSELTPRFSAGSPFMAPLTINGGGTRWLVTTRVPGSGRIEDRTLLERVDLELQPGDAAAPSPDSGASKIDADWLVGSAAGYAAGMDNPRRDVLRGSLWGLAGGLVGVAAGVNVATSNDNTGAGVFTIGLFYAGSAYAAGRFGGKPGQDWWTTQSGGYQAGYLDGYTDVSQKRARRWALISGGAVALIGVAAQ